MRTSNGALFLLLTLFVASLANALDTKVCPTVPVREADLSAEGMSRYFEGFNRKRGDIGDFICCLPERMRKGYMLEHSSIAAQSASPANPRALLADIRADGELHTVVTANGGHPRSKQANAVEMAFVTKETGEVLLHDAAYGKNGFVLGPANPSACLLCHGNPPRLLFDGPSSWPRAVRGMESLLFTTDRSLTMKEQLRFLNSADTEAAKALKENPRFRCLDPFIQSGSSFQMELDSGIARANRRRVAREIIRTEDFDRIKYAVAGAELCKQFAADLHCQLTESGGVGSSCMNWISPVLLRAMTSEATIRAPLREAQTVPEILNAGETLLKSDKAEIEKRIAAANRSQTNPGFDFHFQAALLRKDKLDSKLRNPVLRSPILLRYAVDSEIYGGASNAMIRFLFESRGISTATWGTDMIAGYQREGVSAAEIANLEPPGSRFAAIVKGTANKTACEELRRLSLVATAMPEPTRANRIAPTIR
jgi:hypothetical protein